MLPLNDYHDRHWTTGQFLRGLALFFLVMTGFLFWFGEAMRLLIDLLEWLR